MNTRYRVITLHKRGLSNVEIAQIVGVSRQRVWTVLHANGDKREYAISASVRSASKKTQQAPLSIASVAALLGVHPNTIRRWSDEGSISCFRLGRRQDRRFEHQSIMEMIRKS